MLDLDSRYREFSNGGLGIVVALLVCWQIDFCVHLAGRQSSCNHRRILILANVRSSTKK